MRRLLRDDGSAERAFCVETPVPSGAGAFIGAPDELAGTERGIHR